MIWTSYFANWRNFPKNARLISVARFTPSHFKGEQELRLAPSQQMLLDYKSGNMNEQMFSLLYVKELKKLDKQTFIDEYKNDDVVLLCYETPDQFCHRHLLGAWLGAQELPNL